MTAQRYQAIFDWFRARPAALRALGYAQKISVLGVYLVYGAVLAVTLWQRSGQFWRVLAVPAAVFVLGTLLRAAINRPRPYVTLGNTAQFPPCGLSTAVPQGYQRPKHAQPPLLFRRSHCGGGVYRVGAAWRGRLPAGGGCGCDPRADRGALPQRRTGWPGLWRRGSCDRLPFMT